MISRSPAKPWLVGAVLCGVALAWPTACVVTELGTSMEWNLAMGAGMSPSAELVVEQQRMTVQMERALVSIVSLEVIPCGTSTSAWLRRLSPLGTARAHGGTTPTRMATPHVVDLLAPVSLAWASAVSQPPPDDYCWVRLTIGPADRDAVGMPSDDALADSTLLITGGYEGAMGTRVPFRVTSTRTQSIDVPFLNPAGEPTALVVDAAQRDVAVDVWLDAPAALDGVDPTSVVEAQGGLHALTNLLASVHVSTCLNAPCTER